MVTEMVKETIKKLARRVLGCERDETALLALGSLLSNQQHGLRSPNLNDYEFKIFSQFGDDGIIQYLIKHLAISNETFIEFGVADYFESNTRFLMMNNNWAGFVMDGSKQAMTSLEGQRWYWRYLLTQKAIFIDKENINQLLASTGFSDIGLLHIDLDGNDYHILSAIDFSRLNPSILIVEYNSVFGNSRPITIPYQQDFDRTKAHYSNLYFGASLPAINHAATLKGYAFVGCNRAGNNAYFVRKELLNDRVRGVSVEEGFVESKFRESRNRDYSLSYLAGKERYEMIRGLPVLNVVTDELEQL